MKLSIEHHEEMLRNNKRLLEERRDELARLQKSVTRIETIVAFYEKQIEEAKRRGKDGFDCERFMRRDAPKC